MLLTLTFCMAIEITFGRVESRDSFNSAIPSTYFTNLITMINYGCCWEGFPLKIYSVVAGVSNDKSLKLSVKGHSCQNLVIQALIVQIFYRSVCETMRFHVAEHQHFPPDRFQQERLRPNGLPEPNIKLENLRVSCSTKRFEDPSFSRIPDVLPEFGYQFNHVMHIACLLSHLYRL